MYDRKVVRRRRAALAVFVALSIAILTAYFGESGGGFFHAFQRGAQEAFAPIETGASRALKPVRDLFGWAGDTFDAKKENKDLKKEVERLRSELAAARRPPSATRTSSRALVGLKDEQGFPQGDEAGDRARDRPLADRLVLGHQDRQGLERRHPREPARDRRRERSRRTTRWAASSARSRA